MKKLSFLVRLDWWSDSLVSALAFAPRCLGPSAALATCNIAVLYGIRVLAAPLQGAEVTMEALTQAMVLGCVAALFGLALIAWGFSAWIIRLTAFARACLSGQRLPCARVFGESLGYVRKRKGYLTGVWLVASAYLLIPVSVLCLLILAITLASLIHLGVDLPPPLRPFLAAMTAVVTVVATAYTFIVLVVSSVSTAGAGETAWLALRLFIKRWLPVLVATAVVLGLNTLVLFPQSLIQGGSLETILKLNMAVYVAVQVWFAIISAGLWPLSVMPFCHLLREDLEH